MNNTKLKAREILYLIICVTTPAMLLTVPSFMAVLSGADAWMVFVAVAFIDIIYSIILIDLHTLYPDKTAIGLCREAFGKVLGSVIGVLFVGVFVLKAMSQFKQSAEYINIGIYEQLPLLYVAIPMVLLIIFSVVKGDLIISRFANLVVGIIIAAYAIIIFSSMSFFELSNLMPVASDGVINVLKNTPRIFTWSGDIIFLLMILPKSSAAPAKLKKATVTGMSISYVIIILLMVAFIGVFGNAAKFTTYSALELAEYLGGIIFSQRIDAIVKFIWMLAAFMRDSVFVFCAVASIAELLYIEVKWWVAALISAAVTIPGVIIWENMSIYFAMLSGAVSIICGIIQYLLPLLLLIVLKFKKKLQSENQRELRRAANEN